MKVLPPQTNYIGYSLNGVPNNKMNIRKRTRTPVRSEEVSLFVTTVLAQIVHLNSVQGHNVLSGDGLLLTSLMNHWIVILTLILEKKQPLAV